MLLMTAFTMDSEDFSLDMLMHDGTTTSFLISAKPRITFAEEHVLVETATGESVSFNLADIQEYTYSSVDNGSVDVIQIDMRHDGQISSFTSGNLHFNYVRQGTELIYAVSTAFSLHRSQHRNRGALTYRSMAIAPKPSLYR